ncbi:unnamed protein product [Leuciscus chuanchicus]
MHDLRTSPINCATGSNSRVGEIQEGYEGDVEIITNIGPDDRLVLEEYRFPIGVTFLELVYSNGDSTATVRTIKPLDADVLQELKNIRTLEVQDINDNPPIFQSKTYSVTVSETTAVGSDVLRVKAEDADVSPENTNIIYSILNITTVRVSITDVNDNAPVFSSDTYRKSILVKDAKVGDVLLTLSATDKDAGNNSLISYSFSEYSSMVALDAETGVITLTSDLSEVTEDTLLTLTAIATDHGTPPESDEAEVLIHFKIASLTESNEPEASIVGKVKALTGTPGVTVSYNMKSHEDVFSVDGEGTIKALRPLDKEKEEWFILRVEAIDSRTSPNTAETTVSVQVENVNEAPVFDAEIYKAEIFNIFPYKYPIVKVQASDPDVGESSELQYSLLESTTLLDVEASTGQIYVLDVSSFRDNLFTFHAKATDKHGLFTTTTVQIKLKESVHRDSVSVISLNRPVYIVDKKTPEMEDSIGKVLGWTVKILSVRAEDGNEKHTILRESTDKTYVSFIAMNSSGAVIQATEVKEKLNRENKDLTSELEKVFGPGLIIKVEDSSGDSGESIQDVTIALIAVSVVLAVISVTLVSTIIHLVKFMLVTDPDRESENGSDISGNSISAL